MLLTSTQEQQNEGRGQLQKEAEIRRTISRSFAARPTSSRSRRQSSRGHSGAHSRSTSTSHRPGHQRTASGVRSVVDEGQTGDYSVNQHLATPSRAEEGFLHPDSATFRPQSPDAAGTVIPPSKNGATTRPKHDGIAYPFKLRVDDEGSKTASKNPSLITLDSGDAASTRSEGTGGVEEALDKLNGVDLSQKVGKRNERPGVERYYTAADHFGQGEDKATNWA
jgi:hypothetical protein